METILTLTYVAICIAVFKIFRIPVNQWTLATAALGGIFGLSLLFIAMAYNHPFSTNARIYFTVTPILPGVKGRVVEVPVEDNTNRHLEAGAVLFKVDPKPYEYAVAEKRAGLAEAQANVAQLKASVDEASATVGKAKAQLQLAQTNYDSQAELFQKKRRRAGDTRYGDAESRCIQRHGGPGCRRGRSRPAGLWRDSRRRTHGHRAFAKRACRCSI